MSKDIQDLRLQLQSQLDGNQNDDEYSNYLESFQYQEDNELSIIPENIKIITLSQNPKELQGSWILEPLYKTQDTRKRYWFIGYDDDKKCLYSTFGFIGEQYKSSTNESPVVPKGKRNYQEQAFQEAKYRFTCQCRSDGYHVGYNNENTSNLPMLGYAYTPKCIKQWPVYIDMKLDGIRGLAKYLTNDEHNIKLTTRNGVNYKWLEDQRKEIELFLNYLPRDSELDGEFYVEGYTRNKIQSILNTTKFKHKLNNKIEFYVFDIIEPSRLTLTERWKLLLESYKEFVKDNPDVKYIKLVNKYLAYSHEDVIKHHDYFVKELGAEGAMVKKIASDEVLQKREKGLQLNKKELKEIKEATYNNRRCTSIYKVKNFEDEEGTVVDYDIATGTQQGCITLIVKLDSNGKTVRIGSFEKIELDTRREWATKADTLIGKRFTFKYQVLSEYGIPLHPVGLGFRDMM